MFFLPYKFRKFGKVLEWLFFILIFVSIFKIYEFDIPLLTIILTISNSLILFSKLKQHDELVEKALLNTRSVILIIYSCFFILASIAIFTGERMGVNLQEIYSGIGGLFTLFQVPISIFYRDFILYKNLEKLGFNTNETNELTK